MLSRTLSRATTSTTNLLCCAHTTSIIYYYFISCLSFCSHHISYGIVYFDNQKKKHRGHTKHAIVLTPKLYNKSQTYPSPSCVVAELVCWLRGRWGGGELSSAKFKLQYFGINHTAQCECKHTHSHTAKHKYVFIYTHTYRYA